jgi:3-methyladenine DNA glycosylase AlkC
MAIEKRKGARSVKDIPAAILIQLNKGEIETVNLMEWLAIDQRKLLLNILTQLDRKKYYEPILQDIENLKKQTINTINEAIGEGLFKASILHKDKVLLNTLASHPSDVVRCWACYCVSKNEKLSLPQMLIQIQPFAADAHFGVREIAWLAVRPTLAKNIIESIAILSTWTTSTNENIRRFASEATRPRGVWCEHITELKENPSLALTILEPLKNDPAKYVQDSIGNWLNDASKTQPHFVKTLCKKWEKKSKGKETGYIIKKALRTLVKGNYQLL